MTGDMEIFDGRHDGDAEPTVELDCVGLYCPLPVTMTREAVDELEPGEAIRVLADDPASEEDIPRWARRTGNDLIALEKEGTVLSFVIRKGEDDG